MFAWSRVWNRSRSNKRIAFLQKAPLDREECILIVNWQELCNATTNMLLQVMMATKSNHKTAAAFIVVNGKMPNTLTPTQQQPALAKLSWQHMDFWNTDLTSDQKLILNHRNYIGLFPLCQFYSCQLMLVFTVPERFFLEFNFLCFRFIGRHAYWLIVLYQTRSSHLDVRMKIWRRQEKHYHR